MMKTEHRATPLFLGPKLETYMNTKLHKLLPISAAALLFASMATTATADETVKIGHVAPLTGGIAHLGKDNENGARLAIDDANAKNIVIDGKKVTREVRAVQRRWAIANISTSRACRQVCLAVRPGAPYGLQLAEKASATAC